MPGIQFTFDVKDTVSGAIEGIKGKLEGAFDQQSTLAAFNAGLGQSVAITKQAGDVAREVWKTGVTGSLEEATDAVSAIGAQMVDLGSTSPTELAKITNQALTLSKTMRVDVTEVTRAAGQMMKNGLAPDAQFAFDVIADGVGNGANRSGDFLDVLDEYGPSFNALGINGQMAMDLINSGLDAGAFNADKIGDAFNEFGIRAIDGSKTTGDAYAALGLDANAMSQAIAGGGMAAQQATSTIISALGQMTDPVAQEAAGVALFGSMWEDMGPKAILALDPINSKTDEVSVGVDKMGTMLNDTAQVKVQAMKNKMDDWVNSMIEADGPLGGIMTWAQSFGPEILSVGSQVGIAAMALKDMGLMTKLAAAGQALLNVAMSANPIGIVIALVAALVGGFVLLWNKSEGFRNFFIGMWENIKGAVGRVVDWFKNAFDNAINFISGLGDKVSGIFSSIAGKVGDFFKSPINAAIRGINWIIDQLNKVSFTAPDWVPGVGGKHFGVNIRHIPELAAGGIATGPTLSWIGEGREPEAVLPLSKLDAMLSGGGGGGTVQVTVQGFVGNADELATKIRDTLVTARRRGVIEAF